MIVRTRRWFACAPDTVWPFLLNARMDERSSLLFRLGVPHPQECRMETGSAGVGGKRECRSDAGVVHQRILRWEPGRCLAFRMEGNDLAALRGVSDIEDTFDLVPDRGGTRVARTTVVRLHGRFPRARAVPLYLALKTVHRFVFRNWVRLSEAAEARSHQGPRPHGPTSS